MLIPKTIQENTGFTGRESELAQLAEISTSGDSGIVIVYGRRRVGKTELLEQAFRHRNILKFEGIEKATEAEQMDNVMWQLSLYANDALIEKVKVDSWKEVFKIIADRISKGTWTLYFEEVQWLACYQDKFISELKYIWDNFYRYNKDLILILCGSSPSFIINQVLQSKALYNRSQYEIALQELNLIEAKKILSKRSNREVMDAYLTVGGIPEYLKRLTKDSSVFLALCKNSFTKGGYFTHEAERIFASSMADNKYYREIVEYLSKVKYATRDEILKYLKVESGGKITGMLVDLSVCGFIKKYTPYNLSEDSTLSRYTIVDAYLQFYYKCIKPRLNDIDSSRFDINPVGAIKTDSYYKWLGFSFERFCRKYHYVIAKMLGFSAVKYKSGAYFNRKLNKVESGFQIDLLFMRDDHVCTLCEIKYLQKKVGTSIIEEVEQKIEKLNLAQNISLHKVLITTEGPDNALVSRAYFDNILLLEDFFKENAWS